MKNQPNDIEILRLLSPLSKEQLSKFSKGWQSGSETTIEPIIELYKTISLCLTEANYLPHYVATESLQSQHYKKLLVGWRQQVQQLLEHNSNQPAILSALKKSCHYLWQAIDLSQDNQADKQQRLWYLAELWLHNLAHNPLPKPMSYVALLSGLDRLLEASYKQSLKLQDSNLAQQGSDDIETPQALECYFVDKLMVDIYITITTLSTLDEPTETLISELSKKIAIACDKGSVESHTNDVVRYDDSGEVDSTNAWQTAQAQAKPDVFDMSEDIRQIFIEEATESLDELAKIWPVWQQETQDLALVTDVHRNFYNLKGSGRLIGAFSISEMAWAIENLLIHVLNKSLAVNDELIALVAQALEQLPILIESFSHSQSPAVNPANIILQSNNLLSGLPLLHGVPTENNSAKDNEAEENATEAKALQSDLSQSALQSQQLLNTTADTATDKDKLETTSPDEADSSKTLPISIPAVLRPFIEKTTEMPTDASDADPDIKEIFIEEAYEVLEQITPLYNHWQRDTSDFASLTDVRRGFHTLKGSGRMVGANYSAELAWAIENMLNKILDKSLTPSVDMQQLIADVLAAYPDMIDTFAQGEHDYPAIVSLWVAAANAYAQHLGDDFSYSALHSQWTRATSAANQTTSSDNIIDSAHDLMSSIDNNAADSAVIDEVDSADAMLKTIHSLNDMISDTAIVATEQSYEEREIFEIFIEEARELLQQINDFITAHQHQPHVPVSDEIVRAFHTLRAASGTNALTAISEVSATIEQSLEHLQKHDTPMNAQHIEALTQSVALIEGYLNTYEQSVQTHASTPATQSKHDVESLQAILDNSEQSSPQTDNELSIEQLLALDIDDLLDAEWKLEDKAAELEAELLRAYITKIADQISRLAKNTTALPKFASILSGLQSAYSYLCTHPEAAQDSHIQQALIAEHTELVALFDSLAGRMSFKVDQSILEDLQAALSSYQQRHSADIEYGIKSSLEYDTEHSDIESSFKESSADDKALTLTEVSAERYESEATVKTTAVEELQLEVVNTDVELLEIFLEEAQELDSAIAKTFNQWRQQIADSDTLKVLQRHLHTIKGGARMAGIVSIGDLTDAAESLYESFIDNKITVSLQWVSIMQMVQETLSLQLEYVARYQQSFWTYELIEQLKQLEQQDDLPNTVVLKLPILKSPTEASTYNSDESSAKAATLSLAALIEESWPNGLPDADILEVFLEEAEELVENSQKYLQLFLNNMSDVAAVQTLQRDLHTIKGGARMIAANGIADLAHQMESVYEALAIGRRPATQYISELLTSCHDWLTDAVFILKHRVNPTMPTALIKALQDFSRDNVSARHVPIESLQSQISVILSVQAQQVAVRGVIDISQMPTMTGSFAEPERSIDNSDEMIRISGSLVEHMINLSGESAINRARIDMGMSSLTSSLGEMSVTVQRLTDQLRRMEIELEAQILSQIDEKLMESDDFDPLEMDQYSSLNQLSKSLTESASDLSDINNTLLEKTRDNENLLLQLSRTQTELQDGLMNSRMIPFLRLKPRLDLIVRQTANELNKSVDLSIITADDELDRTILERITSPLEHMLRNAVDHGIESSQERLAAGKERSGHIVLEVLREGSEVVIHLSDDGRGIDINKVREKAIAQGLINSDEYQYTDLEIMQYVFNAGITTSNNVTQISGRGVGMDVVASEVRQLGGSVLVNSEVGVGTRVTMRIPLKVAVSDALVVRVADRQYAIPLIQIERVVRVSPEELYNYYQSAEATMQIEGKAYRVRYLNDLISGSKFNELMMNTNISLPVIIVKNSSGQNLALQVDQIAGSRIEVVVKPMGQQLSHLAGISAATIMGDGSVMLILDIIALLRQSTLKTVSPTKVVEAETSAALERKPTILVVDDSVTVRKVTSRFLERQGLNAVVAKDGVDAMEILQESTPDLILLDIEMPRMDGFEVAAQVRNNQRLQQIPIIMITSRTGDKHRTRAFETGVNDYMGKPFQENELLEKIQALLDIQLDIEQKA